MTTTTYKATKTTEGWVVGTETETYDYTYATEAAARQAISDFQGQDEEADDDDSDPTEDLRDELASQIDGLTAAQIIAALAAIKAA